MCPPFQRFELIQISEREKISQLSGLPKFFSKRRENMSNFSFVSSHCPLCRAEESRKEKKKKKEKKQKKTNKKKERK